jgi:hypothetical protein
MNNRTNAKIQFSLVQSSRQINAPRWLNFRKCSSENLGEYKYNSKIVHLQSDFAVIFTDYDSGGCVKIS